MSRRISERSSVVARPRQKGWWGEPDESELQPAVETAPEPAKRAPVRQPHAAVVTVGRSLTPQQIEAIRAVMRLFIDDDLSRGVDPRLTLTCDRCGVPRQAIGSVRYERATLCHECCVEFEIARARGIVEAATDFVTRYPARTASA